MVVTSEFFVEDLSTQLPQREGSCESECARKKKYFIQEKRKNFGKLISG
jgi:hypothetical protein